MPKIQLSEVVKDFDSNFDYKNLIQYKDPDFLKKKYGEKLFKEFTDWFEDTWYTVLGDAIIDRGDVHHLMAEDFRNIFKRINTDYEDDDLSGYEESDHDVTERVNKTWLLGGKSYILQEVK